VISKRKRRQIRPFPRNSNFISNEVQLKPFGKREGWLIKNTLHIAEEGRRYPSEIKKRANIGPRKRIEFSIQKRSG